MVITKKKEVYSIGKLTRTGLDVILGILHTADSRCFSEQDENGNWYSGEDFVISLTDEERTALSKLGEEIEKMY